MSNPETTLLQRIRLAAGGRPGTRLFRNNVAMAWVGRALRPSGTMTVTVRPGDVVLFEARPLHAGLCEGSPDLVGWRSLTVTQAQVGHRLAVFLGIEVKTPTGRTAAAQEAFLGAVAAAGGIYGVARTPEDAVRITDGI